MPSDGKNHKLVKLKNKFGKRSLKFNNFKKKWKDLNNS